MGEVVGILLTVALLSRFDLVIYAVARVFGSVR
jgi:hypothetical protein